MMGERRLDQAALFYEFSLCMSPFGDGSFAKGIIIRSPSMRVAVNEAPGAYKDVGAVVDAADAAGLARKVARLAPVVCIKG